MSIKIHRLIGHENISIVVAYLPLAFDFRTDLIEIEQRQPSPQSSVIPQFNRWNRPELPVEIIRCLTPGREPTRFDPDIVIVDLCKTSIIEQFDRVLLVAAITK